jgi:hypothetical protein
LTGSSVSDEELKRLYETLSTAAIGNILGWDAETIRKRLKRLGVEMRPRGSVRQFMPPRDELEAEYQNHSNAADRRKVWRQRIFSVEHRRNISLSMRGKVGPLNRNWKGGKTAENLRLRGSIEYREWKRLLYSCAAINAKTVECKTEPFATVAERRSSSTYIMSSLLRSSQNVASILTTAKYSARSATDQGIDGSPSEGSPLPNLPLRLRRARVRGLPRRPVHSSESSRTQIFRQLFFVM